MGVGGMGEWGGKGTPQLRELNISAWGFGFKFVADPWSQRRQGPPLKELGSTGKGEVTAFP